MIDTSLAPTRILERIRSAQKRAKQVALGETAEIAAYLAALGAHGPYRVHILLIDQ